MSTIERTKLSQEYSNVKTYAVGHIVILNGLVLQCTTAITVAENYDFTKWKIANPSLQSTGIDDGGSLSAGTSVPVVDITGGGGSGATAFSVVTSGVVIFIVVVTGGSGYTSAPTVAITGGGSGATATAIITGDVVTSITVNTAGSGYDENTFNIALTNGARIDGTDPLDVKFHPLNIAARNNVLHGFAAGGATHVYTDQTGATIQTQLPPDIQDTRENLYHGSLFHFGGAITFVSNNPIIRHGTSQTEKEEMILGNGKIISGSIISPAGTADLQTQITSGFHQQYGRGFAANKQSPNTISTTAQNPIPAGAFFKVFVNTTGDNVVDPFPTTNTLDPDSYNPSGTGLVVVSNNMWTVQRIILVATTAFTTFSVIYDTAQYATKDEAFQSINTNPTFKFGIGDNVGSWIGSWVIKKGVTDLPTSVISGDATYVPKKLF